MSKLIIFNELETQVLSQDWNSLTLFGETNFVYTDKCSYDLIFHSRQNINPYEKSKPTRLIIPVLKSSNKKTETEEIYSLNKLNQGFNLFAISRKDYIEIYNLLHKKSGDIICPFEKYSIIPEETFFENVNPALRKEIQEKRELIDKYY